MEQSSKPTRGQRNNNPLNIRRGCYWKGLNPYRKDKEFCVFVDLLFGIRAALIIIRRYINQYKCNTVSQIISRWAPSKENNTEAYIQFVCKELGVPSTYRIDWGNSTKVCQMVKAMAKVESNMSLDDDIILREYEKLR